VSKLYNNISKYVHMTFDFQTLIITIQKILVWMKTVFTIIPKLGQTMLVYSRPNE